MARSAQIFRASRKSISRWRGTAAVVAALAEEPGTWARRWRAEARPRR